MMFDKKEYTTKVNMNELTNKITNKEIEFNTINELFKQGQLSKEDFGTLCHEHEKVRNKYPDEFIEFSCSPVDMLRKTCSKK